MSPSDPTDSHPPTEQSAISRRGFLIGAAAAGAAAGVSASSLVGERSAAGASAPPAFHGIHQSSILSAPSHAALFISFDVIAQSRAEVVELLHTITDRARLLVAGASRPLPVRQHPPLTTGSWDQ